MSNWRNIKTAPKDGTLILIKEKDGRVQVAQWQNDEYGYYPDWRVQLTNNGVRGAGDGFPTINVIEWMPIPEDMSRREG